MADGPWINVAGGFSPYSLPASSPIRFFRTLDFAGGISPNIVRYINLLIRPGTNLYANPLNGLDNNLNTLLPLPPDGEGSTICRSGLDPSACANPITFQFGQWMSDNPDDLFLNPGDGFWLNYAGPGGLIMTLAGELPLGTLKNPLPVGVSLKSSIVPQTGRLQSDLLFPPLEEDAVGIYDPILGGLQFSFYMSGAWVPDEPVLSVGQGFVLDRIGPATVWTRNFDVGGCLVLGPPPPAFLAQPTGTNVIPGQSATFDPNVAAGAPLPIQFQWRLNGMNVRAGNATAFPVAQADLTNSGSYTVAVGNPAGAVNSAIAALRVSYPALPFANNFTNRGTITGTNGIGSGSNTSATREAGEPNHAGKFGSNSVWLKWMAPARGAATFSTRGSAFDTLLAVYTGTSLTNLTLVTADEDRGGFFTSEAAFNAQAGTNYAIAIDGFAGAKGDIVFS